MYENDAWTLSKRAALGEGKFILAPHEKFVTRVLQKNMMRIYFDHDQNQAQIRSVCVSNATFYPLTTPPPQKKHKKTCDKHNLSLLYCMHRAGLGSNSVGPVFNCMGLGAECCE